MVEDVYKIKGVGTVVTGKVLTGTISEEMEVICARDQAKTVVKSIQMNNKPIVEAVSGDNVGINLKGVSVKAFKRGDVIGNNVNPPQLAEYFVAQVIILNHPGKIHLGYTPLVKIHSASVACRMKKFMQKIDKCSGKTVEENPKFLVNGDAALVMIEPTRPLCVDIFAEFPPLGRFAVFDMNQTVAVGIVKEVKRRIEVNIK